MYSLHNMNRIRDQHHTKPDRTQYAVSQHTKSRSTIHEVRFYLCVSFIPIASTVLLSKGRQERPMVINIKGKMLPALVAMIDVRVRALIVLDLFLNAVV